MKISVVISAFNEEKNIKECLESVKWADEIILVDNSSQDKTIEIAKKYTSKIFKRPNYKMLNINKNYGFSKATGDWILNLDADERVNSSLKREIVSVFSNQLSVISSYVGYEFPRKNIVFGKWIKHGLWWPDYHLRLFKKGKGKFVCQHVHEKIKVKGKVGRLKNPIVHYNYQTVSQYIQKMNDIYTENEAENFIKSGKRIFWYDVIRMPVNDFLTNFFARKGYKDGLHALVLSLFQAFYTLTVFAKVWEKQKFWQYNNKDFLKEFDDEVKKLSNDFSYWQKKENSLWEKLKAKFLNFYF